MYCIYNGMAVIWRHYIVSAAWFSTETAHREWRCYLLLIVKVETKIGTYEIWSNSFKRSLFTVYVQIIENFEELWVYAFIFLLTFCNKVVMFEYKCIWIYGVKREIFSFLMSSLCPSLQWRAHKFQRWRWLGHPH